jgi:Zn-dependent protease
MHASSVRGVARGPPDLQMALFYLAAMNLTLGLFNLLPAFPVVLVEIG